MTYTFNNVFIFCDVLPDFYAHMLYNGTKWKKYHNAPLVIMSSTTYSNIPMLYTAINQKKNPLGVITSSYKQ